jgi:GT2 family glycosyltransferase
MESYSNVDVIVVNWNAGHQLHDCISSIQKNGMPYVVNTIVVDNGSTDGSARALQNDQNITIIHSETNLGFGKACNLGAQQSKSNYLLFLNPDAALYSETLTKALAFMQDPINQKIGICGVQLVNESGHISKSCSRFPTSTSFLLHALGLDRTFPKLGHFMTEWNHKETRKIDQVIGAFFLVRRELFTVLNGFDERFFVYFEEVDFSLRASQTGWESVYLAHVQAFHAGGGTSNQVKARRLFYLLRSRILYAFKHFSLLGASMVLLSTLFIEPLSRSVLALSRRSGSTFKETWSCYAMLWQWLPSWVLKGRTR